MFFRLLIERFERVVFTRTLIKYNNVLEDVATKTLEDYFHHYLKKIKQQRRNACLRPEAD
jgi:hypothetical protein